MKISLVLATLGRRDEVLRFLESLARQTVADVQLIVVDQNPDDRVQRLLEDHRWPFQWLHLRSSPGLSHARNVGLAHVTGDLVAFPDDDCWYGPDVLARVQALLAADPQLDGVTGRSVDETGRESGGRFGRQTMLLDDRNVWSSAISYTIFLRRRVCDRLREGFDESLGVGAKTRFGSGEETDYLLRAIRGGSGIRFHPELTVFHPNKVLQFEPPVIARGFNYGMGMGRVLRKHRYPLAYRLRALIRPLGGCLKAGAQLDFGRAVYQWAVVRGRLLGMLVNA